MGAGSEGFSRPRGAKAGPTQVELTPGTIERLGTLFAPPAPRPIWPSAVATLVLPLFALGLYLATVSGRSGADVNIATDVGDSQIRMTDLRWRPSPVAVGEVEVAQVIGGQVEIQVPLTPALCSDIARELAANSQQSAACSDGELEFPAPFTIEWSPRALMTIEAAASDPTELTVSRLAADDTTSGDDVRMDIVAQSDRTRLCFAPNIGDTVTFIAGDERYTKAIDVDDKNARCDRGMHVIVGETDEEGGSIPTLIVRDLRGFTLDAHADDLFISKFNGLVDMGSAGSVTVDRASSLSVGSDDKGLAVVVSVNRSESRLTMSGANVTEVVTESGDNVVPTRWERWHAVLFTFTTSLLAAAVTSFVVTLNLFTERVGRRIATA